MLDPDATYGPEDLTLLDDGTMDTVVMLPDGIEWRYSDTSEYRSSTGELDFDKWCREVVLPDMDAHPDIWKVE